MIKKRVKTEQNMVAEKTVKAAIPNQGNLPARKSKVTTSTQKNKKKTGNGIDRPKKKFRRLDVEIPDDDNVSYAKHKSWHWQTNDYSPAESQVHERVSDARLLYGIQRLRELTGWKETEADPAFNAPDATVYLDLDYTFLPERRGHWGLMKLPHPLSMNRSICFLLDSDEDISTVEANLPNYSITGNVKVLQMELARQALVSCDRLALQAMAKRYDTVLYKAKDAAFIQTYMYQEQKVALHLKNLDTGVENALHTTAFLTNEANEFKIGAQVGHLGLTDNQLAENLKAVFNKQQNFPLDCKKISDITIRTGNSEPVSIFEMVNRAGARLHLKKVNGPEQNAEKLREKKLKRFTTAAIRHEYAAQSKIRKGKMKKQRASRELEKKTKKHELAEELRAIKKNESLATQAKILREKLEVRATERS